MAATSGPIDPADSEEPDACETCGGFGVIEADDIDGHGEHITRSRPCPNCGSGDDDGPDPDDFADDE